jgi:K+-transporting ATPase ATPase C chain
MNHLSKIKTPFLLSIVMFVLCGLVYPLVMTGLSQVFFPTQANGSLIYINDQAVGSRIVGQTFASDYYMQSRPSAVNYNVYSQEEKNNGKYKGVSSGSDNYGNSNPDLQIRLKKDLVEFLKKNPSIKQSNIPADLLTASGSGLDPHISTESAEIQIPRIAKASGISEDHLRKIVKVHTNEKLLGIFGESTVNVLLVNLEIANRLGKF